MPAGHALWYRASGMNEQLIGDLFAEATRRMTGSSSREFSQKFAELIVQKCIGTVEGMEPGYKDYRDQIEDAFRRDCIAEIKHQFGIEQ